MRDVQLIKSLHLKSIHLDELLLYADIVGIPDSDTIQLQCA